ncbi:hypothetical protein CDAR_216611 [Caerostris darwini]|uniref:Uncharacterized protein n=1 Tax=Caerostris darwini TaxID=1538125 RepID=A0AAV4WB96_9ARAC|nr:hypothetical protein CDAR_216611 [Caerostris darwini]
MLDVKKKFMAPRGPPLRTCSPWCSEVGCLFSMDAKENWSSTILEENSLMKGMFNGHLKLILTSFKFPT